MAFYYRGFKLEADTFNTSKSVGIRDADTSSLHAYTGGPTASHIQHNGQSQVQYDFTTPFIAHLVRDEPQDTVSWKRFGIEWLGEVCPELSLAPSEFLDCGTPGAKYMLVVVLPIDTNGAAVSFTFKPSDGSSSVVLGPFTTTAAQKTPVAMAFTVPFIVHDFQIVPSAVCRMWEKEAKWLFDPWPELSKAAGPWMNFGTNKPKYWRGITVPMDTNGASITVPFNSSDGSAVSIPANTPAGVKTPVPFAFTLPFISHECQFGNPSGAARIWWEDAQPVFDEWPEYTTEASAWLSVLEGNVAAFLQGLIVPLEANGNVPNIQLRTDAGATVSLVSPLSAAPTANVKTPVPFSLSPPVVCHQAQLVPQAACRVWEKEIVWIAQPTPELAYTWSTQATAHDLKGYQTIARIEAAYASTASVTLAFTTFDGSSPLSITLPSTSGAHKKVLLTLSPNKFMLMTYSATSSAAFQIFAGEWTIWVAPWGRTGEAIPWRGLGGICGSGAAI
jgi:hypothetical protein